MPNPSASAFFGYMKARGCHCQPAKRCKPRPPLASHCPFEPALQRLAARLPPAENSFCCCPCEDVMGKLTWAGAASCAAPLRTLPDPFLGRFPGKIKLLRPCWLHGRIAGCLSVCPWMIFCFPQSSSVILMLAGWRQTPLHPSASQPRAALALGLASHTGHAAWQGKRFPLSSSSFFSGVTFLLPTKLCMPSGQVIKLEDQQYMKKE